MLSKPLGDSKVTQVSDHNEAPEWQHISHNALFMTSQDHFAIEGSPSQMSLLHLFEGNEMYISILNSIINNSFIAVDDQGLFDYIRITIEQLKIQLDLNMTLDQISQSFISNANSLLISLSQLLREYVDESLSTDGSEEDDNDHT